MKTKQIFMSTIVLFVFRSLLNISYVFNENIMMKPAFWAKTKKEQ